MEFASRQNQKQHASQQQRQTISPQMRQGLKLLEMDLGALREELYREMAQNPVIDDVESAVETHTASEVESAALARDEAREADWPEDGAADEEGASGVDAEALERRQHFFDSLVKEETLEEHLLAQLGAAGLEGRERELAATLVGYLDDDGRFAGSMPDLVMTTGATEQELRGILRVIATLDPPGCGTTSLEECLLAQLDKIEEPYREEMRELISGHLKEAARGEWEKIESALGLSRERLEDDMARLRTLEPRPGRAFAPVSRDERYVTPEVHAVRGADGRWLAVVDERDLPEIHFSKKYLAMLEDPQTDAAAREYIAGKIAAIKAIQEAIANRYDTLRAVAQAIFDAQSAFFEGGASALKPLTMVEVAQKAGVHHTTVSRTVAGKFASTPFGVVELRSFFVSGIATKGGGTAAKSTVEARLAALIAAEAPDAPLSDERLAEALGAEGFEIKRRTVAKYRALLGIPGASERAAKRNFTS